MILHSLHTAPLLDPPNTATVFPNEYIIVFDEDVTDEDGENRLHV